MSSGMSMDVVEIVICGLLALWGPPLLFAAFLLLPIRSTASRSRRRETANRPSAVITARK